MERTVRLGTVKWTSKHTKFDSRFEIPNDRCGLCGKFILRYVPVEGKDRKGRWHGMWVGIDCAQKFVDSSFRLKDDQTIIR